VLRDGGTFEVIKHFPVEESLRQSLATIADDVHHVGLDYYWCVTFRTRAATGGL